MARHLQTHLDTVTALLVSASGMPETESWIRIQSLPGTKPRESITTVLRRSSAEEKLVGKSLVNDPFSIRVNHMEKELESDLSVKC